MRSGAKWSAGRSGHKRILLLTGESNPASGFRYLLDSIETVYSVKRGRARSGAERGGRSGDGGGFKQLKGQKSARIYVSGDLPSRNIRRSAPGRQKTDYDWRGWRVRRAMRAASTTSASVFCMVFTIGNSSCSPVPAHPAPRSEVRGRPHTISVPRLNPRQDRFGRKSTACGNDIDFRKIVRYYGWPPIPASSCRPARRRHAARHLRARRVADFGGQPHQSGRLRFRRPDGSRRPVLPRRPPPSTGGP